MTQEKSLHIQIYTDGAARGNPGPGGYGAVLIYGPHRMELSKGYRLTTNNRMELLAVIESLKKIKMLNMDIVVYTDSKYVADAVEKGWLKNWIRIGFKDKKNADLWKQYATLAKDHKIRFQWVKGHNGHPLNERCDQLATTAADGRNLLVDTVFEKTYYNENHTPLL